jgi:hypothetical protein
MKSTTANTHADHIDPNSQKWKKFAHLRVISKEILTSRVTDALVNKTSYFYFWLYLYVLCGPALETYSSWERGTRPNNSIQFPVSSGQNETGSTAESAQSRLASCHCRSVQQDAWGRIHLTQICPFGSSFQGNIVSRLCIKRSMYLNSILLFVSPVPTSSSGTDRISQLDFLISV